MSLLSRIANIFRSDRVNREIDEELQSHIAEAIEHGRDPAEARRSFGSSMRQREQSRDIRLLPWLDSLRADAVFGWRQLNKKKITSAAAILSLALAIGACTTAFRLIDALLLRPLPVANPERLYTLARVIPEADGAVRFGQSYDYPVFQQMRAAVKGQAELIAVSYMGFGLMELTYGSKLDMERAHIQYVSGWMFDRFGLSPALGRMLSENDDLEPGTHPYVVLSYDYWTRRFGRDPKVIGRRFHLASDGMWVPSDQPNEFEIVGVAPDGFTGTEPGTVMDIFAPTMMYAGVKQPDWNWFRTLVQLKPGVSLEPVQQRLRAAFRANHQDRVKTLSGQPKQLIERYLHETVQLETAYSGISDLQREYRMSLTALAVLVALVLLIACANVSNLMTAQSAARAREMALRVSIGAGRWRLVQLVLVESAWLAMIAAMIGGMIAWFAAPAVVGMINPPDNPARLILGADWRVFAFGLALTSVVMLLFGLLPAIRGSAVKPASALKGGDDPHSRGRFMNGLIAIQVAFCFLVLFVAGMFVVTLQRLSNQTLGFSPDGILNLDAVAERPQPPAVWNQLVEHLRSVPGVETVTLASWPLLSGTGWDGYISINGAPPGNDPAEFLNVAPGWFDAMKVPLTDGRDFRVTDTYPGVVIVNNAFVRRYFNGVNPIGKSFERVDGRGRRFRFQIVGLAGDARYGGIRGPIPPVAYVPLPTTDSAGALRSRDSATIVVRASRGNPLSLASILRKEVPRAQPDFRVSTVRTQTSLVQRQTIRERLLATLALFFAIVALLLAAVGLYGVLDYTVLQRRREIGIRMAIGARAAEIARRVTLEALSMTLLGAVAGVVLGLVSTKYISALLYGVKPTDAASIAFPSVVILAAALLATIAPLVRAVRVDPATILRAE